MKFWFYTGLSLAIALTLLLPSAALFSYITQEGLYALLTDPFFYHVLQFTFMQAFISAFLSLVIGLGVARALARGAFMDVIFCCNALNFLS